MNKNYFLTATIGLLVAVFIFSLTPNDVEKSRVVREVTSSPSHEASLVSEKINSLPVESVIFKDDFLKKVMIYKKVYGEPTDWVAELVGIEPKSYLERWALLAEIDPLISEKDKQLLFLFLTSKGYSGLGRLECLSIKNDILDSFLAMEYSDIELYEMMFEILQDEDHDLAWRDYIVQFLKPAETQAMMSTQGPELDKRLDLIKEMYDSVLAKADISLSGTALVSLRRNIETGHSQVYNEDDLRNFSLNILNDTKACSISRTAAIGSVDEDAYMDANAIIHNYAADNSASAHVRMAAIHKLGEYGDSSDIEFLQSLSFPKESSYALSAVRAAIDKLELQD